MAHIYGLVDPRNNKVRYVGKTSDLKERLAGHIRDCRKSNTAKNNWIARLLSLGFEPEIVVIEECEEKDWQERERHWISVYPNLTNWTAGGDGGRQSDECIKQHWVGSKNPASVLSERAIIEIRRKYRTQKVTLEDLAKAYGVDSVTISNALSGKTWKHVEGALTKKERSDIAKKHHALPSSGERNGMSKLSLEDVLKIRQLSESGKKQREIAEIFEISRGHVGKIVTRKRWGHI